MLPAQYPRALVAIDLVVAGCAGNGNQFGAGPGGSRNVDDGVVYLSWQDHGALRVLEAALALARDALVALREVARHSLRLGA